MWPNTKSTGAYGVCKAWWEGGQCRLDADAVPVSERGVGIVYFLPGAGAKIEGSGDWKDWGGDSRSVVTSHRQGSARSCAGSQLPGWPYPGFLEDSVWLQARRQAPETAIAAPTQGQDHFPQSRDPR